MKIKLAKADTESRREKKRNLGHSNFRREIGNNCSFNERECGDILPSISTTQFPLKPRARSENSGKTQFMLAQQKRNVPKGKVASIATS